MRSGVLCGLRAQGAAVAREDASALSPSISTATPPRAACQPVRGSGRTRSSTHLPSRAPQVLAVRCVGLAMSRHPAAAGKVVGQVPCGSNPKGLKFEIFTTNSMHTKYFLPSLLFYPPSRSQVARPARDVAYTPLRAHTAHVRCSMSLL